MISQWVRAAYLALSVRRVPLLAVMVVAALALSYGFSRIHIEEDVARMLPGGATGPARDLALLKQSPFHKKILVHLRGPKGIARERLIAAADAIAAAMRTSGTLSNVEADNQGDGGPWFENVMTGPDETAAGPDFFADLLDLLPGAHTPADMAAMRQSISRESVRERLREAYVNLTSPQGWALKRAIRLDPLNWRELMFAKLAALNPAPGMRVLGGHFISRDGRSALVIADTPVDMTDSARAPLLVAHFKRLSQQAADPDITVDMVAGHAYTAANARIIKQDARRVAIAASIGILLLFLVFIRDWRAVLLLAIPVYGVLTGGMAAALVFTVVSGVTLGFSGVLLGVGVDYGVHVFFAQREGRARGKPPEWSLAEVATPCALAGLTTMAAFAMLLLSTIPAQRQLGVFALAGLAAALFLALFVLPQAIGAGRPARPAEKEASEPRRSRAEPSTVALWGLLLAICAWLATDVRISGDLRQLSVTPPELARAEESLRQAWGGMRDQGMIFAAGPDMESALKTNDAAYQRLERAGLAGDAVSLAPLAPSGDLQRRRLAVWREFVAENAADIESLIREEGEAYNFSAVAFEPFFSWLRSAREPTGLEALNELGLGHMATMFTERKPGLAMVLTLTPDNDQARAAFAEMDIAEHGMRYVSQGKFREQAGAAIQSDLTRFLLLAGAVMLVLLSLLLRRPADVAAAMLPPVSGLLATLGAMSLLGLSLNLFHVVALALIIGLGVDYGIFMVGGARGRSSLDFERGVLVSALTTLAGFGSLSLARHPTLQAIGLTVLLGLTAAMAAALYITPAARDLWRKP